MSYSNIGEPLPPTLPLYNFARPDKLAYAKSLEPTMQERLLLANLRYLKPLSQVVIVGYICDIVIPHLRLVIEVDGTLSHNDSSDRKRSEGLLRAGYHTLHFTNHEIEENMARVILEIKLSIQLLELKGKVSQLTQIPKISSRKPQGYIKSLFH